MMITNLSRDLVEEIFSRVPLKSMRAVQLTCREWNTLSKHRISTLTKMHIGKASATIKEGESLMIVLMNYNLYLRSVFVNNDVDPSTEQKGKLTCLNEQVKISQVLYCDGLLLCILKDDDTKVVVWNPYWAQTRWIELRYSLRPRTFCLWIQLSYALGYENKESCRSYKLLRFIDACLVHPQNDFFWYEIYDFDSDLWTTHDVSPYWHKLSDVGVSLKGNTYWCVSENDSSGWTSYADYIICFDYTRERFGPLLPLPFVTCRSSSVILSCVREEKLAAMFQYDDIISDVFEIWITTMVEAEEVSWSRFLRATISRVDFPFPFMTFLIDEVKKVVMVSDIRCHTVNIFGEAGYFKQVHHDERTEESCWPQVRQVPQMFSYVPSLVQMKQPRGGQRKKQSSLEEHLYHQYMLRLSSSESRCIELAQRSD